MKKPLQLCFALLALALSSAVATALPGRAEVIKVIGNATVTKVGGGSATAISAGMVLGTGDTIVTSSGSTVDLNLGINGDYLRVDPDTSLKIDNLDIANVADRTITTQLNVNRGGITGNVVNKLSLASKYEIKSASGVAGIRGTVYSVKTDANGRITRIVVTSGSVTFNQDGVAVTITAGQALTPPAAGAAMTQAMVGGATQTEIKVVTEMGSRLVSRGANSTVGTLSSVGRTIVNPLAVSVSQ
jgi:hypothetical protein